VRYATITTRLDGDGSRAWHVHDLAAERIERGEDVIALTIGDPDFVTPPAIVEAMFASVRAGRTHYSPARGHDALLDAIALRVSRHAGRPIAREEVVFLPGAQAALYATCLVLLEPGDEVIVPEPAYATYEGVFMTAGATIVHVPLRPERGFHLDVADVERGITERTRVVVINTPQNPTGAAFDEPTLRALVALCERHDLWLVSDEVYAELVFGKRHVSALSIHEGRERVIAISSLSKSHAMTGFRHGWAVGPAEFADNLDRLLQSMLFGSPPFIQDAGLAALQAADDVTSSMCAAYEARARVVVDGLAGVPGVRVRMPEGGMFVLADVRESGLDDLEWALGLLEQEAVAVLPTGTFGPSGRGHVRIGLAASEDRLAEACRRIARYAGTISS
jgi:arginine:pyruvate transaminase